MAQINLRPSSQVVVVGHELRVGVTIEHPAWTRFAVLTIDLAHVPVRDVLLAAESRYEDLYSDGSLDDPLPTL